MQAPTYVAKKVGDQYVVVPKNPEATMNLDRGPWLAGGLLLGAMGIARRGLSGALLTLVGGGLIYRGLTGCNLLSSMLNTDAGAGNEDGHQSPSFQHDYAKAKQLPEDEVDEASMESFPASDAPAKHSSTQV